MVRRTTGCVSELVADETGTSAAEISSAVVLRELLVPEVELAADSSKEEKSRSEILVADVIVRPRTIGVTGKVGVEAVETSSVRLEAGDWVAEGEDLP